MPITDMPIIDIHPHVIATDNVHYPLQPLRGNQSTWSRDRPTPYDKMIEAMDRAGIAKSAIVQASTAYGHDNAYVAEAIAAYPKRFTGVFSIDMLAADKLAPIRVWIPGSLASQAPRNDSSRGRIHCGRSSSARARLTVWWPCLNTASTGPLIATASAGDLASIRVTSAALPTATP